MFGESMAAVGPLHRMRGARYLVIERVESGSSAQPPAGRFGSGRSLGRLWRSNHEKVTKKSCL